MERELSEAEKNLTIQLDFEVTNAFQYYAILQNKYNYEEVFVVLFEYMHEYFLFKNVNLLSETTGDYLRKKLSNEARDILGIYEKMPDNSSYSNDKADFHDYNRRCLLESLKEACLKNEEAFYSRKLRQFSPVDFMRACRVFAQLPDFRECSEVPLNVKRDYQHHVALCLKLSEIDVEEDSTINDFVDEALLKHYSEKERRKTAFGLIALKYEYSVRDVELFEGKLEDLKNYYASLGLAREQISNLNERQVRELMQDIFYRSDEARAEAFNLLGIRCAPRCLAKLDERVLYQLFTL